MRTESEFFIKGNTKEEKFGVIGFAGSIRGLLASQSGGSLPRGVKHDKSFLYISTTENHLV